MLEFLKSKYTYNPETGVLLHTKLQKVVGVVDNTGYLVMKVTPTPKAPKKVLLHRVAYSLYHNIELEEGDVIDHMNGNKLDNRISNLRRITQGQNTQNTKVSKGFFFNGTSYTAAIGLEGKSIYLGAFPTQEAAQEAYWASKKKFHKYFISE